MLNLSYHLHYFSPHKITLELMTCLTVGYQKHISISQSQKISGSRQQRKLLPAWQLAKTKIVVWGSKFISHRIHIRNAMNILIIHWVFVEVYFTLSTEEYMQQHLWLWNGFLCDLLVLISTQNPNWKKTFGLCIMLLFFLLSLLLRWP